MSEPSKPISQLMVIGWLFAALQAVMIGVGGWNIRETIDNGTELSAIKKEIAVRTEMENGLNAQHLTFTTRSEVDGKIGVLKESISQLTAALKENTESVQALREEQILLRAKNGTK